MLHIIAHFWGKKYSPTYLAKLAASVRRNLKQDYQFVVMTDQPERTEDLEFRSWDIWPEDRHLLDGCLVRLRMFDPEWQDDYWIAPGDRIVSLDLDLIVTGPLDPLFERDEPFVILQGANAVNPCKYNGSVWMLRAGAHPEVWTDFSLEAASKVPYFAFPDDQSWMEAKIPNAAGWECGPKSGIWSFQKRGWPKDDKLPEGARIVAFPGRRDPSQFQHLDWVQKHWRA